MTKSTITRERAQQIFLGNGPEPSASEERELARMALAAMDCEPVADVAAWSHPTEERTCDVRLRRHDVEPGPLYRHAQPAPVVPDELLNEIDDLLSVCRVYACRSRRNGSENDIPRTEKAQNWLRACRAAMLAAAPHDTPALNSVQSVVTVPGKWIPVSERMPEDRTQVILWDAEIGEVTSGHYSHKTQTFYHCGDAIENEITHWMLPPSAPQGVKP